MLRTFVFSIVLILTGCGDGTTQSDDSEPQISSLKEDEQVVFFRTAGWLDEASQEWHLPIHGWVYEPQDSSARMAVFKIILEEEFDLSPTSKTESNLDRRLNLLIADNERGKELTIHIAGQDHLLPPSAENGHIETILRIPANEVDQYGAGDFISFSAVFTEDFAEDDSRHFEGEVRLAEPSGLSVISDIDDTVKISNVTDKKKLMEYTFLLDFEAAPGMAKRYDDWSANDVSFHFVSSSPWQLYSPLTEFLDDSGFPWATLSLKPIRFRDETFFDLFKKGTETKPAAIEKILMAYPGRDFVLVGDSGEQDPEVYAALIRKFPDQVRNIYIRNVTQETPDNERFEVVFDGVDPDRWSLFDDPKDLDLPSSP
jgi:hypothetical protein